MTQIQNTTTTAPSLSKYDVPAVRKAAVLIDLLSTSLEPMGITEISQALNVNKHMVLRLVTTLCELGWLNKIDGKYEVSLHLFVLAGRVVNRINIKQAAKEALRQLWVKSNGETSYLVICKRSKALIIDVYESTRSIKLSGTLGGEYPLHSTAPGKAILAWGEDKLFEELLNSKLPRFTKKTITDPLVLSKVIEDTRKRGYSIEEMESNEGGLCFAAPIFDHNNNMVAAVGQTVLSLYYSMDEMIERLGPDIISTAKIISNNMGCIDYETALNIKASNTI